MSGEGWQTSAKILRHPKNVASKVEIPRPVSLIEERVEDFHIIHEVGSCEILSSSVPHISVPLPLDTILTHPKSPSRTFEFCDKSVENILDSNEPSLVIELINKYHSNTC